MRGLALAALLALCGCVHWDQARVAPAAFTWTDPIPGEGRESRVLTLGGDSVEASAIGQKLLGVPVGVRLTVPFD